MGSTDFLPMFDTTYLEERTKPFLENAFTNAKKRAKSSKKNLRFELAMRDLWELWRKQEGKCAIAGEDFDLETRYEGVQVPYPYAPSVDRKNNSLHYTRNNVRLVWMVANFAANEYPDEVLEHLAVCIVAKKNRK